MLSHVYVLFSVVISFVIFNATSLPQVLTDIGGMFGSGNLPIVSAEAIYYLRSYAVIFVLAILGATPIPKKLVSKRIFHWHYLFLRIMLRNIARTKNVIKEGLH